MENIKQIIKERCDVDHKTGCWNWNRYKNEDGYGRLHYKQKQWRAHRLSFIAFKGEIINGLFVCHECDNPGCVNPSHLFLGTNKDNMSDAKEKGRLGKKDKSHPSLSYYMAGCRCDDCKFLVSQYFKKRYRQKKMKQGL